MPYRVVVTGLGAVTALGLNAETTWENLVKGVSGVAPITLFDATDFAVKVAAEVKGFDAEALLGRREARRRDRFQQFATLAGHEAIRRAGLEITPQIADQVGVVVGTAIGGLWTYEEQSQVLRESGPRRLSPFAIPMILIDTTPGVLAIDLGAKGPNFGAVSACASASDAIGLAFRLIQRGDAKAVLTGGAEATVAPLGIGLFDRLGALSRCDAPPYAAPRPFDKERDGLVMGEGAAMLVLEELDLARARGATILAEVAGYAATADATHITAPDPHGTGGAKAMAGALADAGLKPEQVDYINAHGTATELNDRIETAAIKTVFGAHAYRLAVSATKSMTGHMMGATAAVEALVCVRAIIDGVIPPTLNYRTPDPDCDLDYVPNQARRQPVRVALSNAFGFGGHNSTLIFKACESHG
jgi:beta-ketoacyl-acyl-carrier-protein synthase II